MLPFLGRPLLHYLVRSLQTAGITDIVFTSPGVGNDIRTFFSDGSTYGVRIRYAESAPHSGTFGVVKGLLAQPSFEVAGLLLVIYGDSLLRLDLGRFLQTHIERGGPVSILAHRVKFDSFLFDAAHEGGDSARPRTNYGVMEVLADRRINRFDEKPELETISTQFTHPMANAAVYAIETALLRDTALNPGGGSDFGYHVFPTWLASGVPLIAADIGDGYRLDIGTLRHFFTSQMAVLQGELSFDPDLELFAPGVWFARDAIIDRSRAWRYPILVASRARVAETAHVACSVLCEGAVVDDGAFVEDSVLLENAYVGRRAHVSRSVIGPESAIADDIHLAPDTALGGGCRVGYPLVMADTEFQGLLKG
jgi:NDP-sugar pyrophosphorylase family protein